MQSPNQAGERGSDIVPEALEGTKERGDDQAPAESEFHSYAGLGHYYDDERATRLAVALAAEHRGAEALVLQGMIKQGYSKAEIESVYTAARFLNEPQRAPTPTVDPLCQQYNGARWEVTNPMSAEYVREEAFLVELGYYEEVSEATQEPQNDREARRQAFLAQRAAEHEKSMQHDKGHDPDLDL
jgi:hypothetical protein